MEGSYLDRLSLAHNPRGVMVIAITATMGIVDFLAVVLRFVARSKTRMAIGADDWWLVASLVPFYAMIVCGFLRSFAPTTPFFPRELIPFLVIVVLRGGLGLQRTDLTAADVSYVLKVSPRPPNDRGSNRSVINWRKKVLMPTLVTYAASVTTVKISLLLLYRRIFDTPWFKKVSTVVASLCIAWCAATAYTAFLQCQPFSAAFDEKLVFSDHCINMKAWYKGYIFSNLILDFIILSLPLKMVWGLMLPLREKALVMGIFLIGALWVSCFRAADALC